MFKAFVDITNVKHDKITVKIITSNPRKKLFRWIYEVVRDFGYSYLTYIRFAYIFDRYKSNTEIPSNIYQLVGITCLFIAAKISEPKCLNISEYSLVTDSAFHADQIKSMESVILNEINFGIDDQLEIFEFIRNNDLIKNIILCYLIETKENPDLNYLSKNVERIYSCYLENNLCEGLEFYLENCKDYEKENGVYAIKL
ncbi:G2/mitotic-specific cyclin-B1 [Dictyocoela muelleri]|nr:G2/mitotic-specific cyclin-B1 [Dictyocoela muelleri]